MRWGVHTVDGHGRPSEDRHVYKELPGGKAIAAVFDGHSGLKTVVRTVATLPDKLAAMWAQVGDDETALRAGLRQVFIEHDKSVAQDGFLSYKTSGCTATVALISPTTVTFAFLGDSPAFVLDTTTGTFTEIGKHVPTRPDERARILQNGGDVTQDPGDAPRVNGMLMVSRAFGDFALKFKEQSVPEPHKDWAKDFCVVADPEILVVPRPKRGVLALMSDGMVESPDGDVMPTSAVVDAVKVAVTTGANLEAAAKAIVNKHVATATDSQPAAYEGDDLTLLLVDVSAPLAPAPVPSATLKGGFGAATRKARARRRDAARTGKKKLPKTFMI
jgi:serine/threonine protein phosphatase PrpC